jgi:hypothetical protein
MVSSAAASSDSRQISKKQGVLIVELQAVLSGVAELGDRMLDG